MKKYLKFAFVAAFAAIAGYGVYTSQKTNAMSELVLANVEALATPEQPSTNLCSWPSDSDCWALHPTDPSKDEVVPNMNWPNS